MASSTSLREAYGALRQLGNLFVKSGRDAPLSELLPFVEAKLVDRLATLSDAGQRPGATTSTVLQALIDEENSLKAVSGASAAPRSPSEGGSPGLEVRGDAVEAAILTSAFKDIGRQLDKADLNSEAGRLEAMAVAFDVKCPLAIRAVCKPLRSSAILARVPTLAILSELHRTVPVYLSWLLSADSRTKVVPNHMKRYDIRGLMNPDGTYPPNGVSFLRHLLEFDWVNADWVYSPGGLLVWRAIKNGGGRILEDRSPYQRMVAHLEECHPYDIYTRLDVVKDLGGFIDQILMAMGFEAEVEDEARDGVPFASFLKFYLTHLEKVSSYVTIEERYRFLDHCHQMFSLSLRKLGEHLQGGVYGAVYRGKDLSGGLLRHDEDPILAMEKREAARVSVLEMREEYDLFMRAQGSAVAPVSSYQPTLRSGNPAHAKGAAAAKSHLLNLYKEAGSSSSHYKDRAKGEGRHAPQESKPRLGTDGDAEGKATQEAADPGTLVASWAWLSRDELYVSGLVWNIEKLAKFLRVSRDSKCWPWLLTLRSDANKPGVCNKWGKPGHKSTVDAAHKSIPTFDRVKHSKDPKLCRVPTAEERQQHSERMTASGIVRPPSSKGSGRGRFGRGRGVRGGSQLSAHRA